MDKHGALRAYAREVNDLLRRGGYTEPSFRPQLRELLRALMPGLEVKHEPAGPRELGTPDFLIRRGAALVGFVECKAIDRNLEDHYFQKDVREQLAKYRQAVDNLIFTNYRQFWLFQGGSDEPALRVDLGRRLSASRSNLQELLKLVNQFLAFAPAKPGDPKTLAELLAARAKVLKEQVLKRLRWELKLKREDDISKIKILPYFKAFDESLIRGITPEQFADAYAQTVTYGLFMARYLHAGPDFSRASALELPETFHLVRVLFNSIAGEIPADMEWIVDSIVWLLGSVDLHGILSAFGRGAEDPFIHFYETFLAEFNPEVRERRGVYFTPEPVVSFILNSVNYLLKTRFGKELGLADRGVTVLDPALGTGTFLEFAFRLMKDELTGSGSGGLFPDFVREHILQNFYGFELLIAPYTVAHIKLTLTLEELGYKLKPSERLQVYLTNTLDPTEVRRELFEFPFVRDLAEETKAANRVKRDTPILVIVGNPPYSGISANMGEWITGLLKGELPDGTKTESYYEVEGKPLGERNPKWLQDDYVKFIRFAQWKIQRTGQGIVAFITNHAYLDNPTFRGMREKLLKAFDEIYILNLHGNARKKEVAPDGSKDENVFDIQQGVAIGIFVKLPQPNEPKVYYADLWGSRERKYEFLSSNSLETVEWQEISPSSPSYLFVNLSEALLKEYQANWSVQDIFGAP